MIKKKLRLVNFWSYSIKLQYEVKLSNQCYLPIQKLAKMFPSKSSLVTSPVMSPK